MKSQGHIVTEPQTREIKVLFRKTKLQIYSHGQIRVDT